MKRTASERISELSYRLERIASHYASSNSVLKELHDNKNFERPVQYEEEWTRNPGFTTLVINFHIDPNDVANSIHYPAEAGYIFGSYSQKSDISSYNCAEDLTVLSNLYPKVKTKGGKIRLVEVGGVGNRKKYRGQGLGTQMYLQFARSFWDKFKKPFILIPNECNEGETSDKASRVWNSLAKNNPSYKKCIVILNRP